MNIYDVSRKAGVSIATVSRVLNGSPNVSERTRALVLEVMNELGYTPNVFARGLGLGSIQTIGIMCSDSSDPYLAHAIYYLEQGLRSHGYDSILCCTGSSLETKQKYFDLLRSKKVDAIILAGSKFIEPKPKENDYIMEAAKELPIMLVNGWLEGENIYSTLCDDRLATHNAASKLIVSGCRNILYLYTSRSYSGAGKLNGYQDALRGCGLPVREEYIYQCPKDILAARDLFMHLHSKGLPFDAVLASDDTLAVGAVKYAHATGRSIPDELSIIGYNNSSYAICTDPELTSIDSKIEALCTTTINTLMGVFNGSNVPSRTTIAADLIKRATTKF
ncbi:MAG: LacI family transcriptional regulator [Lachnospiraceae bacterium]|jgi:DNA-binding LacI/PurR family transcriptional regulator|nr:LacI family transcriptional regulator [Lachnospiraceae bacterium]